MKDTQFIRNIGLFGHSKCGKTSLAEALLFTAGKISRLGKVDDGTSSMDYEPEETAHQITINSSFQRLTWNKHDIFLTDTPGDENFLNDSMIAAQVVDSAIFTVGAVLAVKKQTLKIAEFVNKAKRPTLVYINKMDRDRADFTRTLNSIKEDLPFKTAVTQLPIGAEDSFQGIIDLISQQAFTFNADGKASKTDIPDNMLEQVASYREELMELVAETDDELIEVFLEEGELATKDLKKGLIQAVKASKLCPIMVGAATANTATSLLLDAIVELMPCPTERPSLTGTNPNDDDIIERNPNSSEPFSAQVIKTMANPYAGRLTIFRVISGVLSGDSFYNASKGKLEKFSQLLIPEGKENKPVDSVGPGMIAAVAKLKETVTGDTLCAADTPIVFEMPKFITPSLSYAVTATKKDDADKLFSSITKMIEEDPTLHIKRATETNETLISGIGINHLHILGEKIQRKFGVGMSLQLPKVAYKETINGKAKVQYKHKKQSGGRGQYADNCLEIEPLPRGDGYEFEDCIVGGVIPKQYIPAVDKGVQETMKAGILAGYPIIDIKVRLVDGSFHNVDSSEMAFKISGSMAFKKGFQEAKPVLLEPIMNINIKVQEENVGDVIGDLNSRRGKVMGMIPSDNGEIINAQAPMAEILEYGPELAALTGGLGSFNKEFSHYSNVPAQLSEKIIAEGQK